LQIHELRNLSVRRLVFRQSVQTYRGCMRQRFVAGQRHPDRANGSVSPKDGRIAAFAGARTGGCRQDTARRQISLQQLDGLYMAGFEQRLIV
jgi:hypothetical protein